MMQFNPNGGEDFSSFSFEGTETKLTADGNSNHNAVASHSDGDSDVEAPVPAPPHIGNTTGFSGAQPFPVVSLSSATWSAASLSALDLNFSAYSSPHVSLPPPPFLASSPASFPSLRGHVTTSSSSNPQTGLAATRGIPGGRGIPRVPSGQRQGQCAAAYEGAGLSEVLLPSCVDTVAQDLSGVGLGQVPVTLTLGNFNETPQSDLQAPAPPLERSTVSWEGPSIAGVPDQGRGCPRQMAGPAGQPVPHNFYGWSDIRQRPMDLRWQQSQTSQRTCRRGSFSHDVPPLYGRPQSEALPPHMSGMTGSAQPGWGQGESMTSHHPYSGQSAAQFPRRRPPSSGRRSGGHQLSWNDGSSQSGFPHDESVPRERHWGVPRTPGQTCPHGRRCQSPPHERCRQRPPRHLPHLHQPCQRFRRQQQMLNKQRYQQSQLQAQQQYEEYDQLQQQYALSHLQQPYQQLQTQQQQVPNMQQYELPQLQTPQQYEDYAQLQQQYELSRLQQPYELLQTQQQLPNMQHYEHAQLQTQQQYEYYAQLQQQYALSNLQQPYQQLQMQQQVPNMQQYHYPQLQPPQQNLQNEQLHMQQQWQQHQPYGGMQLPQQQQQYHETQPQQQEQIHPEREQLLQELLRLLTKLERQWQQQGDSTVSLHTTSHIKQQIKPTARYQPTSSFRRVSYNPRPQPSHPRKGRRHVQNSEAFVDKCVGVSLTSESSLSSPSPLTSTSLSSRCGQRLYLVKKPALIRSRSVRTSKQASMNNCSVGLTRQSLKKYVSTAAQYSKNQVVCTQTSAVKVTCTAVARGQRDPVSPRDDGQSKAMTAQVGGLPSFRQSRQSPSNYHGAHLSHMDGPSGSLLSKIAELQRMLLRSQTRVFPPVQSDACRQEGQPLTHGNDRAMHTMRPDLFLPSSAQPKSEGVAGQRKVFTITFSADPQGLSSQPANLQTCGQGSMEGASKGDWACRESLSPSSRAGAGARMQSGVSGPQRSRKKSSLARPGRPEETGVFHRHTVRAGRWMTYRQLPEAPPTSAGVSSKLVQSQNESEDQYARKESLSVSGGREETSRETCDSVEEIVSELTSALESENQRPLLTGHSNRNSSELLWKPSKKETTTSLKSSGKVFQKEHAVKGENHMLKATLPSSTYMKRRVPPWLYRTQKHKHSYVPRIKYIKNHQSHSSDVSSVVYRAEGDNSPNCSSWETREESSCSSSEVSGDTSSSSAEALPRARQENIDKSRLSPDRAKDYEMSTSSCDVKHLHTSGKAKPTQLEDSSSTDFSLQQTSARGSRCRSRNCRDKSRSHTSSLRRLSSQMTSCEKASSCPAIQQTAASTQTRPEEKEANHVIKVSAPSQSKGLETPGRDSGWKKTCGSQCSLSDNGHSGPPTPAGCGEKQRDSGPVVVEEVWSSGCQAGVESCEASTSSARLCAEAATSPSTSVVVPEDLARWLHELHVTEDTARRLVEEGFNSVPVLAHLEQEDLRDMRLPKGQQRLLLHLIACLERGESVLDPYPRYAATETDEDGLLSYEDIENCLFGKPNPFWSTDTGDHLPAGSPEVYTDHPEAGPTEIQDCYEDATPLKLGRSSRPPLNDEQWGGHFACGQQRVFYRSQGAQASGSSKPQELFGALSSERNSTSSKVKKTWWKPARRARRRQTMTALSPKARRRDAEMFQMHHDFSYKCRRGESPGQSIVSPLNMQSLKMKDKATSDNLFENFHPKESLLYNEARMNVDVSDSFRKHLSSEYTDRYFSHKKSSLLEGDYRTRGTLSPRNGASKNSDISACVNPLMKQTLKPKSKAIQCNATGLSRHRQIPSKIRGKITPSPKRRRIFSENDDLQRNYDRYSDRFYFPEKLSQLNHIQESIENADKTYHLKKSAPSSTHTFMLHRTRGNISLLSRKDYWDDDEHSDSQESLPLENHSRTYSDNAMRRHQQSSYRGVSVSPSAPFPPSVPRLHNQPDRQGPHRRPDQNSADRLSSRHATAPCSSPQGSAQKRGQCGFMTPTQSWLMRFSPSGRPPSRVIRRSPCGVKGSPGCRGSRAEKARDPSASGLQSRGSPRSLESSLSWKACSVDRLSPGRKSRDGAQSCSPGGKRPKKLGKRSSQRAFDNKCQSSLQGAESFSTCKMDIMDIVTSQDDADLLSISDSSYASDEVVSNKTENNMLPFQEMSKERLVGLYIRNLGNSLHTPSNARSTRRKGAKRSAVVNAHWANGSLWKQTTASRGHLRYLIQRGDALPQSLPARLPWRNSSSSPTRKLMGNQDKFTLSSGHSKAASRFTIATKKSRNRKTSEGQELPIHQSVGRKSDREKSTYIDKQQNKRTQGHPRQSPIDNKSQCMASCRKHVTCRSDTVNSGCKTCVSCKQTVAPCCCREKSGSQWDYPCPFGRCRGRALRPVTFDPQTTSLCSAFGRKSEVAKPAEPVQPEAEIPFPPHVCSGRKDFLSPVPEALPCSIVCRRRTGPQEQQAQRSEGKEGEDSLHETKSRRLLKSATSSSKFSPEDACQCPANPVSPLEGKFKYKSCRCSRLKDETVATMLRKAGQKDEGKPKTGTPSTLTVNKLEASASWLRTPGEKVTFSTAVSCVPLAMLKSGTDLSMAKDESENNETSFQHALQQTEPALVLTLPGNVDLKATAFDEASFVAEMNRSLSQNATVYISPQNLMLCAPLNRINAPVVADKIGSQVKEKDSQAVPRVSEDSKLVKHPSHLRRRSQLRVTNNDRMFSREAYLQRGKIVSEVFTHEQTSDCVTSCTKGEFRLFDVTTDRKVNGSAPQKVQVEDGQSDSGRTRARRARGRSTNTTVRYELRDEHSSPDRTRARQRTSGQSTKVAQERRESDISQIVLKQEVRKEHSHPDERRVLGRSTKTALRHEAKDERSSPDRTSARQRLKGRSTKSALRQEAKDERSSPDRTRARQRRHGRSRKSSQDRHETDTRHRSLRHEVRDEHSSPDRMRARRVLDRSRSTLRQEVRVEHSSPDRTRARRRARDRGTRTTRDRQETHSSHTSLNQEESSSSSRKRSTNMPSTTGGKKRGKKARIICVKNRPFSSKGRRGRRSGSQSDVHSRHGSRKLHTHRPRSYTSMSGESWTVTDRSYCDKSSKGRPHRRRGFCNKNTTRNSSTDCCKRMDTPYHANRSRSHGHKKHRNGSFSSDGSHQRKDHQKKSRRTTQRRGKSEVRSISSHVRRGKEANRSKMKTRGGHSDDSSSPESHDYKNHRPKVERHCSVTNSRKYKANGKQKNRCFISDSESFNDEEFKDMFQRSKMSRGDASTRRSSSHMVRKRNVSSNDVVKSETRNATDCLPDADRHADKPDNGTTKKSPRRRTGPRRSPTLHSQKDKREVYIPAQDTAGRERRCRPKDRRQDRKSGDRSPRVSRLRGTPHSPKGQQRDSSLGNGDSSGPPMFTEAKKISKAKKDLLEPECNYQADRSKARHRSPQNKRNMTNARDRSTFREHDKYEDNVKMTVDLFRAKRFSSSPIHLGVNERRRDAGDSHKRWTFPESCKNAKKTTDELAAGPSQTSSQYKEGGIKTRDSSTRKMRPNVKHDSRENKHHRGQPSHVSSDDAPSVDNSDTSKARIGGRRNKDKSYTCSEEGPKHLPKVEIPACTRRLVWKSRQVSDAGSPSGLRPLALCRNSLTNDFTKEEALRNEKRFKNDHKTLKGKHTEEHNNRISSNDDRHSTVLIRQRRSLDYNTSASEDRHNERHQMMMDTKEDFYTSASGEDHSTGALIRQNVKQAYSMSSSDGEVEKNSLTTSLFAKHEKKRQQKHTYTGKSKEVHSPRTPAIPHRPAFSGAADAELIRKGEMLTSSPETSPSEKFHPRTQPRKFEGSKVGVLVGTHLGLPFGRVVNGKAKTGTLPGGHKTKVEHTERSGDDVTDGGTQEESISKDEFSFEQRRRSVDETIFCETKKGRAPGEKKKGFEQKDRAWRATVSGKAKESGISGELKTKSEQKECLLGVVNNDEANRRSISGKMKTHFERKGHSIDGGISGESKKGDIDGNSKTRSEHQQLRDRERSRHGGGSRKEFFRSVKENIKEEKDHIDACKDRKTVRKKGGGKIVAESNISPPSSPPSDDIHVSVSAHDTRQSRREEAGEIVQHPLGNGSSSDCAVTCEECGGPLNLTWSSRSRPPRLIALCRKRDWMDKRAKIPARKRACLYFSRRWHVPSEKVRPTCACSVHQSPAETHRHQCHREACQQLRRRRQQQRQQRQQRCCNGCQHQNIVVSARKRMGVPRTWEKSVDVVEEFDSSEDDSALSLPQWASPVRRDMKLSRRPASEKKRQATGARGPVPGRRKRFPSPVCPASAAADRKGRGQSPVLSSQLEIESEGYTIKCLGSVFYPESLFCRHGMNPSASSTSSSTSNSSSEESEDDDCSSLCTCSVSRGRRLKRRDLLPRYSTSLQDIYNEARLYTPRGRQPPQHAGYSRPLGKGSPIPGHRKRQPSLPTRNQQDRPFYRDPSHTGTRNGGGSQAELRPDYLQDNWSQTRPFTEGSGLYIPRDKSVQTPGPGSWYVSDSDIPGPAWPDKRRAVQRSGFVLPSGEAPRQWSPSKERLYREEYRKRTWHEHHRVTSSSTRDEPGMARPGGMPYWEKTPSSEGMWSVSGDPNENQKFPAPHTFLIYKQLRKRRISVPNSPASYVDVMVQTSSIEAMGSHKELNATLSDHSCQTDAASVTHDHNSIQTDSDSVHSVELPLLMVSPPKSSSSRSLSGSPNTSSSSLSGSPKTSESSKMPSPSLSGGSKMSSPRRLNQESSPKRLSVIDIDGSYFNQFTSKKTRGYSRKRSRDSRTGPLRASVGTAHRSPPANPNKRSAKKGSYEARMRSWDSKVRRDHNASSNVQNFPSSESLSGLTLPDPRHHNSVSSETADSLESSTEEEEFSDLDQQISEDVHCTRHVDLPPEVTVPSDCAGGTEEAGTSMLSQKGCLKADDTYHESTPLYYCTQDMPSYLQNTFAFSLKTFFPPRKSSRNKSVSKDFEANSIYNRMKNRLVQDNSISERMRIRLVQEDSISTRVKDTLVQKESLSSMTTNADIFHSQSLIHKLCCNRLETDTTANRPWPEGPVLDSASLVDSVSTAKPDSEPSRKEVLPGMGETTSSVTASSSQSNRTALSVSHLTTTLLHGHSSSMFVHSNKTRECETKTDGSKGTMLRPSKKNLGLLNPRSTQRPQAGRTPWVKAAWSPDTSPRKPVAPLPPVQPPRRSSGTEGRVGKDILSEKSSDLDTGRAGKGRLRFTDSDGLVKGLTSLRPVASASSSASSSRNQSASLLLVRGVGASLGTRDACVRLAASKKWSPRRQSPRCLVKAALLQHRGSPREVQVPPPLASRSCFSRNSEAFSVLPCIGSKARRYGIKCRRPAPPSSRNEVKERKQEVDLSLPRVAAAYAVSLPTALGASSFPQLALSLCTVSKSSTTRPDQSSEARRAWKVDDSALSRTDSPLSLLPEKRGGQGRTVSSGQEERRGRQAAEGQSGHSCEGGERDCTFCTIYNSTRGRTGTLASREPRSGSDR